MTRKTGGKFFAIEIIGSLLFLLTMIISAAAQGQPQKSDYIKFKRNFYQRITDTLYACQSEVTQEDYKSFLSHLSQAEYDKCKIDPSLWKTNLNFSDSDVAPMIKHYHVHPAFNRYPVVNISYYGAVKYCEWLTMMYSKSPRRLNVKFKLPSAKEWILLSNTNPATKLPYEVLNGKNKDNIYVVNIKAMAGDSFSLGADGGYYTVRTDSYWPNKFGLRNVIGNAAEMTDVEGLQKGGSWLDGIEDCHTDKFQTYATPDPRVGFRVVAIISRK